MRMCDPKRKLTCLNIVLVPDLTDPTSNNL